MKTLTTAIQDREASALESLLAQLAAARKGGITNLSTLLTLLFIAQQRDGTTATRIADEVDISTAGVTGTLDSLEKFHFVDRTHNRDDRRVWKIRITDKGREFVDKLLAA